MVLKLHLLTFAMLLMGISYAHGQNEFLECELLPATEAEADSIMSITGDRMPVAKNLKELYGSLSYPKAVRRKGIEGWVVFKVLFDQNGSYETHKVLTSPHEALTRECAKHIAVLRVTPALMKGQPTKVWVTVPFKFIIQD